MKLVKRIFEKDVMYQIKWLALISLASFIIFIQMGMLPTDSWAYILCGLIGYQIGIGYETYYEHRGNSENLKGWQEEFKKRRAKAFATKVVIFLFILFVIIISSYIEL